MAGHDLDAAASALRAAILWSGQQPDQQTVSAIAAARRTAMKLLSPNAQPQDRAADETARAGTGTAQDTDQAQPAGARLSSSQTRARQRQGGQAQGRIPQDASKAVEQLGNAIQQCAQKIGAGDGAGGGDQAAKDRQDQNR
jgi:hypothetical protein